jgi:hypothetical protein
MRIGVPTEIKSNEFRVGLVPGSVRELTAKGHEVYVRPAPAPVSLPMIPPTNMPGLRFFPMRSPFSARAR